MKRLVTTATALLAMAACGCQLPYFLMAKEPKKKVAAEYEKLSGARTAIIVWADAGTLDEDYAARYRVADRLRYDLSQRLKDAKFVDIRDITEYQEKNGSDWEGQTNAELGRRFKADFVLRVDILEYTTRALDAREVRKGRIRATISIYDVRYDSGDKAAYATEVTASYPQDQKVDVLNRSDIDLLNGTLRVFGDKVTQKFSEHEVSY